MVTFPTRADGPPRHATGRRLAMSTLLAALCAAAGALLFAPAALAKTYSDVPKAYWDRADIVWVTNQGPPASRALDDFADACFKPSQPVTREQFARALVVVGGLQNLQVAPVAVPDVAAGDPYLPYIQIALHFKLLAQYKNGFRPTATMLSWQVDGAVVRLVRELNSGADWTMLSALNPTTWEPNPGWKTGAPAYLPTEVAARFLGLRFNHPARSDALEVSPREVIDRAETAAILYQARHLSKWSVGGLSAYDHVTFPTLTDRQKQIVAFAFQYIGYPYVWGGEYPTKSSPYGTQAHGGFDCSGFDWWVMKMNFGYTLNERVAAAMAAAAKPRIRAGQARHRRPDVLRSEGAQVDRRLDLPRGALPGQRLVHPVDRLAPTASAFRRSPTILLEVRLRLGPASAEEGPGEFTRRSRASRRLHEKGGGAGALFWSCSRPPSAAAVLVATERARSMDAYDRTPPVGWVSLPAVVTTHHVTCSRLSPTPTPASSSCA
jgi:cell wall-associated NlpC family hydrolase